MKKTLLFISVFFTMAAVFAQTAEQPVNEEEIELPEVTTVISGGALTAGKDSVPDYKKILPEPEGGSIQLPQMDKVEEKNAAASEYNAATGNQQSVFAEGKIGGGYPFSFIGDFSVYRSTGNAPFEIKFAHENMEGYGLEKSSDGFFLRQTSIDAEKKWINEGSTYNLSGAYSSLNEGFQGQSDSYTDSLWNDIWGSASAEWNLKKGFYIKTKTEGGFYNRYGTEYNGSATPANEYEKSARLFHLVPEAAFGWADKGFDVSLKGRYATQLNLKDTDTLETAPDAVSSEAGHKGNFTAAFEWNDENVKLWSQAGLTFGTHTGSQKVIFPFALGLDFDIPYKLSSRNLILSAEGGCWSGWHKANYLEIDNPYTVVPCIPNEQTDWYGIAKVEMPVSDKFSFNFEADFFKTAFDNGVWMPDYKDESTLLDSGYYVIQPVDRTEFNTICDVTVNFKMCKFTGAWSAYWIDVPSFKDDHTFTGAILVEPENAKWNAGISAEEMLGSDADKVPVLGASASVKASSSIRLALEAADIIKLVTGKTRTFAHSKYEDQSGHITALVKFQF